MTKEERLEKVREIVEEECWDMTFRGDDLVLENAEHILAAADRVAQEVGWTRIDFSRDKETDLGCDSCGYGSRVVLRGFLA